MKSFYATDPDIIDLERQSHELYAEIKRRYKFIKYAPGKVGKEYYESMTSRGRSEIDGRT
jgi:hypothetical protein